MKPDDEDMSVADLLHNVKELVELDHWFGIQALPRPNPDEQISSAPAQRELSSAAPKEEKVQELSPLPDIPDGPRDAQLSFIAEQIAACERCGLCSKRTNVVPGEGNIEPELVFIGEGPGADEDRQGLPFVGAAGQLLDKMIVAMGLSRQEVYITNIVKCRPPGNRAPEEAEANACFPYLLSQIDILKPKVICTLGNTPLRALCGNQRAGITRMRGKPFEWRGYTVVPTFHPSYLLRNEAGKKPCWEDLKSVLNLLGRTPPGR